MKSVALSVVVGPDGVLNLILPLALTEEPRKVRVTVEDAGPAPLTQEEDKEWVMFMAGKWLGEFERPEPTPPEGRDPL